MSSNLASEFAIFCIVADQHLKKFPGSRLKLRRYKCYGIDKDLKIKDCKK